MTAAVLHPASSWPEVLGALMNRRDLSAEATSWAMEQILAGDAAPAQLAAFAVALRAKGETVSEIDAMVEVMLTFATPIEIGGLAVDVVGTGGDRSNTVNISTMAAVVAAAAGARVVKHGNRAASSACGAADVLEALGVALDLSPQRQQQVVDEVGIGFLFAPLYHPALRHAGPVRKQLGVPTTFNFLGPLANPAQPVAQAVGVADERMAELVARTFANRGNQGLVVHGSDGLDELTTTTTSSVWCYADGEVTAHELDPVRLGLPRADVSDLVGGGPEVNAGVVREVFGGRPGPVRDIVALNAAAALLAYDKPTAEPVEDQLVEPLRRAQQALDSGAATQKLADWVSATRAG